MSNVPPPTSGPVCATPPRPTGAEQMTAPQRIPALATLPINPSTVPGRGRQCYPSVMQTYQVLRLARHSRMKIVALRSGSAWFSVLLRFEAFEENENENRAWVQVLYILSDPKAMSVYGELLDGGHLEQRLMNYDHIRRLLNEVFNLILPPGNMPAGPSQSGPVRATPAPTLIQPAQNAPLANPQANPSTNPPQPGPVQATAPSAPTQPATPPPNRFLLTSWGQGPEIIQFQSRPVVTPGVYFFRLHDRFFTDVAPRCHPRLIPRCRSMWHHWREQANRHPHLADAINQATTQCPARRYVDRGRQYAFNAEQDLVVFCLQREVCYGPRWARLFEEASADGIYDALGRRLRRVGIRYHMAPYPCAGPHEAGAAGPDGNPWRAVMERTPEWCDDACKVAMCRFLSFFRDAQCIYILFYIREQDFLRGVWNSDGRRNSAQGMAQRLRDNQRENGLERFDDAGYTWVELDDPTDFVDPNAFDPWELWLYLSRYKRFMLGRLPGQINERMRIKVLVTTHFLRWNSNYLFRM